MNNELGMHNIMQRFPRLLCMQKKHYGWEHTEVMYCIRKSMRGAELPAALWTDPSCPHSLPHRTVGRYCLRNEPAYLGTEMVEDGAAGRVLDDEIEQLHRRICVLLVYKIQPLLHSLIASLMWSFHCVDLRPAVG